MMARAQRATQATRSAAAWAVAGLCMIAIMAPSPARAVDTLLAISALNVDPSSPDRDDWINVLSVGYTLEQAPPGSRRIIRPDSGKIILVKEVDASSPKLLEAVSEGTYFNRARIDFASSAGARYARIQLEGVRVSGYVFSPASMGTPEVPVEQLTLNYEKISLAKSDRDQAIFQEFHFDQFTGRARSSIFVPGRTYPSLLLPAVQKVVSGKASPILATVSDPDSPLGKLILSATSSNQALIPDEAIEFEGDGAQREILITPPEGGAGAVELAVTVSDGENSTTERILVLVNSPQAEEFQFSLTPSRIPEHSPAGTTVGTLMVEPASGEAIELVDSAGGIFRAEEGKVIVNDPLRLDFERLPRTTIAVRTTSPGIPGPIFGLVEIQVQNVAEGFFDEWRERHFSAAELLIPELSGPDGDADNDGLKNGVECALDLPPRDGTMPPHAPRVEWITEGEDSFLIIKYRKRPGRIDPDTIVRPEFSPSGRRWFTTRFQLSSKPTQNADGEEVEEVTARYELPLDTEDSLLMRLRILR